MVASEVLKPKCHELEPCILFVACQRIRKVYYGKWFTKIHNGYSTALSPVTSGHSHLLKSYTSPIAIHSWLKLECILTGLPYKPQRYPWPFPKDCKKLGYADASSSWSAACEARQKFDEHPKEKVYWYLETSTTHPDPQAPYLRCNARKPCSAAKALHMLERLGSRRRSWSMRGKLIWMVANKVWKTISGTLKLNLRTLPLASQGICKVYCENCLDSSIQQDATSV